MDIENLVTSIGALAEISETFYDALIQRGLNADEAMDLTKHLISTFLKK